MPMTFAEKLLARQTGLERRRVPGQIVTGET